MKTTLKLATLACFGFAASSANATFLHHDVIDVALTKMHYVSDHLSSHFDSYHNHCPQGNCTYYGFNSANVSSGNAAGIQSINAQNGNVVHTDGGLGVYTPGNYALIFPKDASKNIDNYLDKTRHENLTITFENPTKISYFTLGDITTSAHIDLSYTDAAGASHSVSFAHWGLSFASVANFFLDTEVTSLTFSAGNILTDFNVQGICVEEVPVPAAAWLFGSALAGLAGLRRKK